ncbi:MAG: hypothetical protein HC818_01055 [Synechococcaceae cyanobacterium RM1_1_27]|nr:hypothetical protein [Synechococcaceae cyanobacterium SM2_3_2]NJO85446.1 hypothetical protein [Synechococcaceae cyanobacterium RM1_1_27]
MSYHRLHGFALLMLCLALLPACSSEMEFSFEAGSGEYQPLDEAEFVARFDLLPDLDPAEIGIQMLQGYRLETEGRRGESLVIRYPEPDQAELRVTVEGLGDDSIQDQRYRIEMTRSEANWQIESIGIQVRCRAERGHQNWSPDPCL